MSKEFFKTISKSAKENHGGTLFMVIDQGTNHDELLGQKLFISKDKKYYNNKDMEVFWEKVLSQVTVTQPGVHELWDGLLIFGEQLRKKPTIVLCGGGHVSLYVYQVAIMTGFDVAVIDDREEFANEQRFPLAKEIICGEFSEVMGAVDFGPDSYYVIATRGHSHDGICLVEALKKPHTYVGMIGSHKKVHVIQEHLRSLEFTEEQIKSVYTPIGLAIDAQTPEEISISIMAEIIQVRRKDKLESFVSDEALELIVTTDEPVVLSMILNKDGSIPRGAGAKMAVTKSGISKGSIGGGAVEHEAKLESMNIAGTDRKPSFHRYTMGNTDATKEGMACGGNALVYIEDIKSM